MRISIAFVVALSFCCSLFPTKCVVNGASIDGQGAAADDTSTTAVDVEGESATKSTSSSGSNNNDVLETPPTTEDIIDLDDVNTSNISTSATPSTQEESVVEESSSSSLTEEENVITSVDNNTSETPSSSNATSDDSSSTTTAAEESKGDTDGPPVQMGPFIDLLGETLLSLEMVDERRAKLHEHYTNEVLLGKTVVGLYFSADWCGPCRQFTPDLVNFYNRINSRKGREGQFEIVWISRCRDYESFAQYFTQMNWLAMQPEDAMGTRGQQLALRYKVKGIPSLVLLDEVGNVITLDARNKIPQDKAGIGFPWRNPIAQAYVNLVPKSVRLLIKTQLLDFKENLITKLKLLVSNIKATRTAAPA